MNFIPNLVEKLAAIPSPFDELRTIYTRCGGGLFPGENELYVSRGDEINRDRTSQAGPGFHDWSRDS